MSITLLKNGSVPEFPDKRGIDVIIGKVAEMIKDRKMFLVIKAETASGKSTALPAHLWQKFKRNVVSLQPRILTTMTLPNQLVKYYGMTMGKDVGYQTSKFSNVPEEGVVFLTYETFGLIFFNTDDETVRAKYGFIIFDEAHESSFFVIIVHYYLKTFIKNNAKHSDCPFVIITSASFDEKQFITYYKADYVFVRGASFEITDKYLPYNTRDYVISAVEEVHNIHRDNPDDLKQSHRDILLFVADDQDAHKILNHSKTVPSKDKLCWLYLNSHNMKDKKHFNNVINATAKDLKAARKIIIATNVAETGITFKNLKYVIDTGYYKSHEYSPDTDLTCLFSKPITRSSFQQRRGRVGRETAGYFHALYTEETRDKMIRRHETSAVKQDLSRDLLVLIGLTDIEKADLIIELPALAVRRGLEKLFVLGFITEKRELTMLGKMCLAATRISLEELRIIMSGYVWELPITDLIATIYAIRNGWRTFANPSNEDYLKHNHCQFYRAIKEFYAYEQTGKCDFRDIDDFLSFREMIINDLYIIGMNPFYQYANRYPRQNNVRCIKQCIYEGLQLNLCSWNGTTHVCKGLEVTRHFKFPVSNFVHSGISVVDGKTYINGFSILDGYVNPIDYSHTPDIKNKLNVSLETLINFNKITGKANADFPHFMLDKTHTIEKTKEFIIRGGSENGTRGGSENGTRGGSENGTRGGDGGRTAIGETATYYFSRLKNAKKIAETLPQGKEFLKLVAEKQPDRVILSRIDFPKYPADEFMRQLEQATAGRQINSFSSDIFAAEISRQFGWYEDDEPDIYIGTSPLDGAFSVIYGYAKPSKYLDIIGANILDVKPSKNVKVIKFENKL